MKIIPLCILLFLPFLFFGQTDGLAEVNQTILQHQYDKGLELIKNLPDSQKKTPQVYYYKGVCEAETNDFDAAILSATYALKNLTKKDSLYPNVMLLRAWTYAKAGKLKKRCSG